MARDTGTSNNDALERLREKLLPANASRVGAAAWRLVNIWCSA